MNDDKRTKPTDTGGFEAALAELIHQAVLNGIDVEGGWDVLGDGDTKPEFTVEVYRLEG